MKYIIPGDPIALARCRFGKGRVWDGQKDLKRYWAHHLANQHEDSRLYRGALCAEVFFFMRIPLRAKRHQQMGMWHTNVPDLDNLLKFIFDVGNGILYEDDKLIAKIITFKQYDDEPRTELIITEMSHDRP